jgi:two-component system OmpR family sensor kinase
MFGGKGTDLNSLEKKSFYSFLALYLGSSLFFILLSGFWYFSAQKSALENATYYKLQHLADQLSGLIIHAQMSQTPLHLPKAEEGYSYMFIPLSQKESFKSRYFEENGYKVLVSSGVQKHMGIEYVVVKSDEYAKELHELERNVLFIMSLVFLLIVAISWMLSKLFMRPIHEKVRQIEQFIQDISHELNTPITALQMSAKRAVQKGVYDEKILSNISISTKQLYSIYQSLSFLNFQTPYEQAEIIDLKPVLERSVEYYRELLRAKNITIKSDIESVKLEILPAKAELLFSNLLSNAIKYSLPNTNITLTLKEGYFSIADEGVGIAKEKLEEIFKLYQRASNVAGGFGVGLHIVKQICDEFGVSVEVSSKPAHGSLFELSWTSKE